MFFQISYRENLSAPIDHRLTVERVIGKQNNLVTMAMKLVPGEVNAMPSKRNTVIDQDKLPLKHYQRNAVEQGVLTALTYGEQNMDWPHTYCIIVNPHM